MFIATPHQGSPWASRPVGRLGGHLVKSDPADLERHRRLIDWNPGVFSKEIQKQIPTSIDMLRSDSHMLQAIRRLHVARHVRVHSIIGTGMCLPCTGPGDGVVAVTSATYPCSVSQHGVPATHMKVRRHPETVKEVARILQEHLFDMAAE